MTQATKNKTKKPEYGVMISELTGAVIGGRTAEIHDDGEITILFGGIKKRGKPLSNSDILMIEAGGWTGEPLLREQRIAGE